MWLIDTGWMPGRVGRGRSERKRKGGERETGLRRAWFSLSGRRGFLSGVCATFELGAQQSQVIAVQATEPLLMR